MKKPVVMAVILLVVAACAGGAFAFGMPGAHEKSGAEFGALVAGSDKAELVLHVSGKIIELPVVSDPNGNQGLPEAHDLSGAGFGAAVAGSDKDFLVEHVSGGKARKP